MAFNVSKSILAFVFCVLAVVGSHAQTNTWTGSLDNDWHKTCNWSLNQLPACSHDVVIPNTTNKPRITGVAHSRTIEVQYTSGAHLYVETNLGAQLYVSSTNGGTCSGTPTNNSSACCPAGSALLSYTGNMQSWQVPACVSSITYTVRGAQGGSAYPAYSRGGYGGTVTGTLSVTPNETLYFYVGGAGNNGAACTGGAGGFNGGGNGAVFCGNYGGGGGGGASDIR
ncbi:MAG TPA: glycine-rich protein, partial [Chitinophagales bacterium]|nr:glycine-rich protein [Chitinophagales bacterium]